MLIFFRRIRKGLLGNGATSKYLLYAIGEIALVVVGILIALQINNWNEERKFTKTEAYTLNEILSNLEEDADQMKLIVERRNNAEKSSEKLVPSLSNGKDLTLDHSKDVSNILTFERFYHFCHLHLNLPQHLPKSYHSLRLRLHFPHTLLVNKSGC